MGCCTSLGIVVDRDLNSQGAQGGHEFLVKSCDGTWNQRHGSGGSLARENEECVIDEVKINCKGTTSIRNGRRGEPTRGDIQCDLPPVVQRGTEFQPYLPDDLGIHVERLICVLPCLKWQRWP